MHLRSRYAERYAGHWVVAHGDTLTLPQMGDRFKLIAVVLDPARRVVGRTCRFRGALAFQAPRAETLAVTWLGQPEQALIYGWPAELGPFAGIGAVRVGDSLAGAILFDERLGVRVRSEEHTSELQSLAYLVCRLLLEKKKKNKTTGA